MCGRRLAEAVISKMACGDQWQLARMQPSMCIRSAQRPLNNDQMLRVNGVEHQIRCYTVLTLHSANVAARIVCNHGQYQDTLMAIAGQREV